MLALSLPPVAYSLCDATTRKKHQGWPSDVPRLAQPWRRKTFSRPIGISRAKSGTGPLIDRCRASCADGIIPEDEEATGILSPAPCSSRRQLLVDIDKPEVLGRRAEQAVSVLTGFPASLRVPTSTIEARVLVVKAHGPRNARNPAPSSCRAALTGCFWCSGSCTRLSSRSLPLGPAKGEMIDGEDAGCPTAESRDHGRWPVAMHGTFSISVAARLLQLKL